MYSTDKLVVFIVFDLILVCWNRGDSVGITALTTWRVISACQDDAEVCYSNISFLSQPVLCGSQHWPSCSHPLLLSPNSSLVKVRYSKQMNLYSALLQAHL